VAQASMKVCVVEDDASMRRALRRLLKAANYEVIDFESAEALLQSGEVRTIDCLVADVNLPGSSGIELINLLSPLPPTIVITSFDYPGLEQNALKRGAIGYLKKPFEGQDLLKLIKSIECPS
jgi:FixJ family two-component response regulator